jgi:hypothetical protein
MEGIMDDAVETRDRVFSEKRLAKFCVFYDAQMRVVIGISWTLFPRRQVEMCRLFENTVKNASHAYKLIFILCVMLHDALSVSQSIVIVGGGKISGT